MLHIAVLNHELASKKNNKSVLIDLSKKALSIVTAGISDIPTFLIELIEDSKKIIENKYETVVSEEVVRIERDINDMIIRVICLVLERNIPFVLILDDLQWIDTQSKNFLLQLIRTCEDKKLLIISTCWRIQWAESSWNEFRQLFSKVGELTVIELSRIEDAAITEMIGDFYPNISVKYVNEVCEIVDGNPLYLEEIIKVIKDDIDEFFIDGDSSKDFRPNALSRLREESIEFENLIGKRFKSLPDNVRKVLEFNSSQGRHFSTEIAQLINNNSKTFDFDLELEVQRAANPFFIIENKDFTNRSYEFVNRYYWDAAFSRFERSQNREAVTTELLKLVGDIETLNITVNEKINLLSHLRHFPEADGFELLVKITNLCISNKLSYQALENFIELENIYQSNKLNGQDLDVKRDDILTIVYSMMVDFPLFFKNGLHAKSNISYKHKSIFETVSQSLIHDEIRDLIEDNGKIFSIDRLVAIAKFCKEIGDVFREFILCSGILNLISNNFSITGQVDPTELYYYSFFSAREFELALKSAQNHEAVSLVFECANSRLKVLNMMGDLLREKNEEYSFDGSICNILLSRSFAYLKHFTEGIYEGVLGERSSEFRSYCHEVDYLGDWFASIRLDKAKNIESIFDSFTPWKKIVLLNAIDFSLKLACHHNFAISNEFLMEAWNLSRLVVEEEVDGVSNPLSLLNAALNIFGSVTVLINLRQASGVDQFSHQRKNFKLLLLEDLHIKPDQFEKLYMKAISAADFIISSNRYGLQILSSRIWLEWVYLLADEDSSVLKWEDLFKRAIQIIDLSNEPMLIENTDNSVISANIFDVCLGILQDPNAKLSLIDEKINELSMRYAGLASCFVHALESLKDK